MSHYDEERGLASTKQEDNMGNTDPNWWTPERRREASRKRKLAYARAKRLKAKNGDSGEIHIDVRRRTPAETNEKLKARHTGSLLQRALASQPESKRTENAYHTYEMAELALAWACGQIDRHQVARALQCSPGAVEGKMHSALRWGLNSKTIEGRMRPRTTG